MRCKIYEAVFALVLGIMIPACLFSVLEGRIESGQAGYAETTEVSMPEETLMFEPDTSSGVSKNEISILFSETDTRTMELEEYLVGVILAEMPSSFELEALKAQAVVARTYALRQYQNSDKHDGAAVCINASCCQGYISPEEYIANRGTAASVDKVKDAVYGTRNIVITYQNKLIEATYFSCSGGKTEDALAVWGADVPYLQATDSPGEEKANNYVSRVTFTKEEFAERLGLKTIGPCETWVGEISYTEGNGVDSIVICGVPYSGTQLRKLLELRSTVFVITGVGDNIIITTKGFGHRVGMSQYGAEAMAAKGYKYQDILYHYYKGVNLTEYQGINIDIA